MAYPVKKSRELHDGEKLLIRKQISTGKVDIHELAREFSCSPSQIAGIKAAMTKGQ
ncbi:MAG: hypothetical protein ABJA67_15090 [Chthonomonadales bacterium]